MTTTSDVAMYGRPTSEQDGRRQLVRDYDRVASSADDLERKIDALREDLSAPTSCGGRPDLVADVDRALIAVARLRAWAWEAAKVAAKPAPVAQPTPETRNEAA